MLRFSKIKIMNKLFIGTSLFLTSIIIPVRTEESKNYLTIGGGISFPSDSKGDSSLGGTLYDFEYEVDNTAIFTIGLGREFDEFRLEFNYSKATVEADTFTVTSGGAGVVASVTPALESDVTSYMIYGLKDFPTDSKFTPYAGIGLGLGHFSAKDQTATVAGTAYQFEGGDETVFSYGLKGGVSYAMTDNASLFTEGLYQGFASYEISEPGFETVNYDGNQYFGISVGVKFSF